MELEKEVKEFMQLLLYKEKISQELTKINKKIAQKNDELLSLFTEHGINKIQVNGIEFKPSIKKQFSLIEGDKWDNDERFKKWLSDIGEDDLWQIKKTIPFNTREKFLRDYLEEKKQLPDFIKINDFGYIKYNKSQIKKEVMNE